MNDRIRELAESCMIEEYNQHGNLIEDGFDYGKFAELIIVDVINRAERYGLGCDAVEQLKEDFGVKE